MSINKHVRIVASILVCVLLDIALHLATSAYSTMPENPHYSIVAKFLGVEMTVSLWAIFSFSSAAYVYWAIRKEIPGEGVEKGVRYGAAIALMWLFAMLEGVSLFGNPLLNEFMVGLSDAIPVFFLGILLSLVNVEKGEDATVKLLTLREKMTTISIFAGVFLIGRYTAYFTGVIESGLQTRPLYTLLWTLLMGAYIGLAVVLLDGNRHSSAKYGFMIFGINWAAFLVFMPLLFQGFLIDAFSRIIIDTVLVTIGYYLAFLPKVEPVNLGDG